VSGFRAFHSFNTNNQSATRYLFVNTRGNNCSLPVFTTLVAQHDSSWLVNLSLDSKLSFLMHYTPSLVLYGLLQEKECLGTVKLNTYRGVG